jgi:hypothetical protein
MIHWLHFAYLDPGTGSLFVQAVIGSVLAGGYVLRNSIRRAFHKLTRNNPPEEDK